VCLYIYRLWMNKCLQTYIYRFTSIHTGCHHETSARKRRRRKKTLVTHTFSCKWALVHFEFSLTRSERFFFFFFSLVIEVEKTNNNNRYNPWDNIYLTTRLILKKRRRYSLHNQNLISRNYSIDKLLCEKKKKTVHLCMCLYPLLSFRYHTPDIMMKGC
jgi:hypothetical protein